MKRIFGIMLVLAGVSAVVFSGTRAAQTSAKQSHKVIIYPTGDERVGQLKQQGITKVTDYGSYWVAEVTDDQMASLKSKHGNRLCAAENFNKIELESASIDTTVGEPEVPNAFKAVDGEGRRLRIVQFTGPIRTEWLKAVKAVDGKVTVLHYVPNNAYLVQVDQKAEQALEGLKEPSGPIQWIGAYHPYYKAKPTFLTSGMESVTVRVGLVNSMDGEETANIIQGMHVGREVVARHIYGEIDMKLALRGADLLKIAQMPDVLWIAPVVPFVSHEEKADLISANQTSVMPGHAPVAPTNGGLRYLSFLTNVVGFVTNPVAYPVLDICDTGLDDGTTTPYHPAFYQGPTLNVYEFIRRRDPQGCPYLPPTVPADRILGPTRVTYNDHTDSDGHGTLVASLACGYDDNTNLSEVVTYVPKVVQNTPWVCGAPAAAICIACCDTNWIEGAVVQRRDNPDGFQFGHGISPFGRFGVSWGPATSLEAYQVPCALPPTSPFNPPMLPAGSGNPAFDAYEHAARIYIAGHAARISNNSWGEPLVRTADCTSYQNAGYYGVASRDYDILTRDALLTGQNNPPGPSPMNQEMIYVFSAGDSNGVSNVGGFGDALVTPPGTAKNVLTVGATENVRDCGLLPPSYSDDSFDISYLTSYGPTADGRFKPEIVAPGNSIMGAQTQFPKTYDWGCDPEDPFFGPNGAALGTPPNCDGLNRVNFPPPDCPPYPACGEDACEPVFTLSRVQSIFSLYRCGSGTSMSAPQVSGAVQLLWWYFQNRLLNEQNQHLFQPSPAMAKAYIVNSARYLPFTNPQTGIKDKLPSMAQGMGMLDIQRMFDGVPRVIRDETTLRAIDSPLSTTNPIPNQTYFSASGQTYEFSGRITDATQPFRVTLAWSDAVNDPGFGKQLVNDLHLAVTVGGKTYYGNWFDREFSVSQYGQRFDTLNNLESVFLPAGQTGTWSIVVRADTIAGNAVPNVDGATVGQDFALVVYNGNNPSDVPVPASNNSYPTAIPVLSFPSSFTNAYTTNLYHRVYPNSTAGQGGGQEFFKVARPTLGTTLGADTFGSNFDTILSVWKGTPGTLIEVASNDDAAPDNLQSTVSWKVDEVTDYYILVQGRQAGNGSIAQGTMVLNVQATQPPITFLPPTLDFGSIYIGNTSSVVSVIYTNGSPEKVDIISVAIAGVDAGNFILKSDYCTGKTLPSGGSCTLRLQFAPDYPAGPKSATLLVNDSATGSPRMLPLTGTALEPTPFICVNTSSLMFGTVGIGSTSTPPVSVTITNCGTTNLFMTSIFTAGSASNDFIVVGETCVSNSIPVGGTCSINLAFAPTAAGVRQATLNFASNAGVPTVVSLSGNGEVPVSKICLSAGAVAFGGVTNGIASPVRSLVITNCGTAPLNVSLDTITGPDAGQFAVVSDLCTNAPIPVGGTCVIGLQFTPTVLGAKTAQLEIYSDAVGSPHIVPLTGNSLGSQPDMIINKKRGLKKALGIGLLYPSPDPSLDQQTLVQKGRIGKVKKFYVSIRNLGNVADHFSIQGIQTNCTARYFLGAFPAESLDITPAVVAGTFSSSLLAGGAVTGDATLIRVEVTPTGSGNCEVEVKGASTVNALKTDSVRARVTVK